MLLSRGLSVGSLWIMKEGKESSRTYNTEDRHPSCQSIVPLPLPIWRKQTRAPSTVVTALLCGAGSWDSGNTPKEKTRIKTGRRRPDHSEMVTSWEGLPTHAGKPLLSTTGGQIQRTDTGTHRRKGDSGWGSLGTCRVHSSPQGS